MSGKTSLYAAGIGSIVIVVATVLRRLQRRVQRQSTSMPTPFRQCVEHKISVAQKLGEGGCGGDYSDACILIAVIVSGISADLWPAPGADRLRFIEAWVRYAASDKNSLRISVPLLRQWLLKTGRRPEAAALEEKRPHMFGAGNEARVLVGADVDLTEQEVTQTCPQLTIEEIREWSYPAVFYAHVRSSLIHEYHLGDTSSGWPMTERPDATVSYVNPLRKARLVHFHLPWLIEVVRSIAVAAEAVLSQRPLPVPQPWWGAKSNNKKKQKNGIP
jgi:hypothetical protein